MFMPIRIFGRTRWYVLGVCLLSVVASRVKQAQAGANTVGILSQHSQSLYGRAFGPYSFDNLIDYPNIANPPGIHAVIPLPTVDPASPITLSIDGSNMSLSGNGIGVPNNTAQGGQGTRSWVSGAAAGPDVTSCLVTVTGGFTFSGYLVPGDQFNYSAGVTLAGTYDGNVPLGGGGTISQQGIVTTPGMFTRSVPVDLVWGSADGPDQQGLWDYWDYVGNMSGYFVRTYSPSAQPTSATSGAGADDTASSVDIQMDISISFSFAGVGGLLPTGDYNGDGIVDARDYTVWRDSLGSTGNLAADGDNSGTVDQADYDLWRLNFGNHSGSGAGANAAVPEPAAIVLAACGLMMVVLPCVRRRSV